MVTWYFSFNILSWILYSLILTFLLLLTFSHLCSTPLHIHFSFPCFFYFKCVPYRQNIKIPLKKSNLNNSFSSSMLTFWLFLSLVLKWSPTLFDPMNCSMPGSSVLHYLSPGVHSNPCPLNQWCNLTILSYAAPFFFCLQSFSSSRSFPMTGSSHQVAKVLDLHLQHQSFQWMFRVDYLLFFLT